MLLHRLAAPRIASCRSSGYMLRSYSHARPQCISIRARPARFNLLLPSSRNSSSSTTKTSEKIKQHGPVDAPVPVLWYHRLGPVSKFFAWFHQTQEKKPRLVQLCMTMITYMFGDLIAQAGGSEEYDPWRTLRMLTIGGIAALPGYRWFIWLGNHFNYASKALSIAAKVVVQQIVFTPIFNTYFFGMQAALTGVSAAQVLERIEATVPTSIINSCKFWPAVTAITFAFVAPPYRFMFSGLFAIIWQGYLSFLNRREERHQRALAA